jgi:hypothetical protein
MHSSQHAQVAELQPVTLEHELDLQHAQQVLSLASAAQGSPPPEDELCEDEASADDALDDAATLALVLDAPPASAPPVPPSPPEPPGPAPPAAGPLLAPLEPAAPSPASELHAHTSASNSAETMCRQSRRFERAKGASEPSRCLSAYGFGSFRLPTGARGFRSFQPGLLLT